MFVYAKALFCTGSKFECYLKPSTFVKLLQMEWWMALRACASECIASYLTLTSSLLMVCLSQILKDIVLLHWNQN